MRASDAGTEGLRPVHTDWAASKRRELVFAFVAPLGVDKSIVRKALRRALQHAFYKTRIVKISELLREYAKDERSIDDAEPLERKRLLMNVGDQLRRKWNSFISRNRPTGEFGAVLAISGIHQHRFRLNAARGITGSKEQPQDVIPVDGFAYIVDALKHPDELDHLRKVYGPAFISIGIYSPPQRRRRDLLLDAVNDEGSEAVETLMARDEDDSKLGQRVADAFYATDFIVDATQDPDVIGSELDRLIRLVFGDVFLTPRIDEYGMFLARAAQVRSASLARQIGAAILRDDGTVVSTGTNEAAKPLVGGQYWPPDDETYHGRDMVYRMEEGGDVQDTSDWFREEMITTVLDALDKEGALPKRFRNMTKEKRLKELYYRDGAPLRNTRVKDNIDYVRDVHAEGAAIIDASRHGVAVKGTRMMTTTFPCHECARHIVAAGICEVVYLEPYPKSGTRRLYRDSIALDPVSVEELRVVFRTFVGVAPPRYLDFFTLGQRDRKENGKPVKIDITTAAPALPYYTPSERSVMQAEGVPLKLFDEFTQSIVQNGGIDEQTA